ncbi:MAG: glycosyltransferase family 2 protein [Pseudomonadota bacterium]
MTCIRDEGPYLVEWLSHHLAAGFDHMLVLSHDCTDGSDQLLDMLSVDPRITHMPFEPAGPKTVQWQALERIKSHELYRNADWALFFDCDEFLCSPKSVSHIIDDFSKQTTFDALTLPWRFFGANGQKRRKEGLTPERFKRAAPFDLHFPLAHLFKTLHRPRSFRQPGVHRPRLKKNSEAIWMHANGQMLPSSFAQSDAAITLYGSISHSPKLWLNHYSLRSVEEFLIKRARGLPNHMAREIDLQYWVERNWNTVEACEIDHMLPSTKRYYDTLLKLPGIEETHQGCLKAHKERHRVINNDLEALRLSFRLNMVPESRPPTPEEAKHFIQAQLKI